MAQNVTILGPGDVISGKYRLLEELGRGSYGVVFRAVQLGIERDVAIKTLLPQTAERSEEVQRFEREARLVSRLTHPNIITLFDYGEHDGVLYMVMEYIEGRSLGALIRDEAPVAHAKARALVYQLLDALQYAHDQGVVHRDLKPENILLVESRSMQQVDVEVAKILDFGIAKVVQGDKEPGSALDTLTQTGFVLGTPQYMSPENITGDPVTHQADLYAMGLIMYELLTGAHPFQGTNPHTVMVSHLRDDPPPLPPEVGAKAWQRAISMCLEKQPDERIQSARAIREVLERDAAKALGRGARAGAPSLPAAALFAAIAALVAAVSVGAWWAFGAGDGAAEATATAQPEVVEGAAEAAGDDGRVAHASAHELTILPDELDDDDPAPAARADTTAHALPRHGGDGHDDAAPPGGRQRPEAEAADAAGGRASRGAGIEAAGGEAAGVPTLGVETADASASGAASSPGAARRRVAGPRSADPHDDPHHSGRRSAPLARAVEPGTAGEEHGERALEQITLHITSVPESARVTLDGRPIGVTPLAYRLARSETPVTIGLSLIGYRESATTVVPSETRHVDVRLEKGRLQMLP